MGASCLNVDLARAAPSKGGRRPCCKNAISLQLQARRLWFGAGYRARAPHPQGSSAMVPCLSPVPNAWLLSLPCRAGVQHRGRPAVHQEAHRQSDVNHDQSNSQVCPGQAGGNQSPGTWHERLGGTVSGPLRCRVCDEPCGGPAPQLLRTGELRPAQKMRVGLMAWFYPPLLAESPVRDASMCVMGTCIEEPSSK